MQEPLWPSEPRPSVARAPQGLEKEEWGEACEVMGLERRSDTVPALSEGDRRGKGQLIPYNRCEGNRALLWVDGVPSTLVNWSANCLYLRT